MVEERRVVVEDSYVDDILTSHNDLRTLEKITKGVEKILKAGGFSLKPWVLSGQSGRSAATPDASISKTTVSVPKTRVGYEPETDKLRVMASEDAQRGSQR